MKGVSKDKRREKWFARIKLNGKTKFLGYHNTPEAAHKSYCDAADRLHGNFACTK
jgi:hypothetical protein